ncbi:hypothetical protein BYT27DRAFT_6703358 [Phlegmacium glaucopus]|nr:hypothetical protein BYT27DRAFT_6703358 [Phlegmacium glaucopus]
MAPVDHGGFNYLRAAQHLQAATTPPNLYIIRNRHRPWVHPKPSSENIHATPEQPLNANNAFIFVGNDTAKRGLKAAPPIIPNFKPHHLPPPPTDSESPEQETVFEKIHTAESSQYLSKRTHTYQPPTTPPSEAGGVIRKTLEAPRRGSRSAKARGDQPQRRAKSCKTRPPAAATPEIQSDYRSDQTVNVDATDWACVAQTFTAAAGAYESPRASYSKVPVVPQVQYDNAQLENGSLSLCELEFESESSHVGFDLSFSFGLDLLPRREYEDLIRPTFTTSHENFWSPEGYSYGTDDFQSSPNS